MHRIPFDQVQQQLAAVLRKLGFYPNRAHTCARLFAETTCDGVYTHGINRFPRYVATIRNGSVLADAEPKLLAAHGALERWDGRRGPGNLNALAMMDRALALSREHGIGCVALANTNHWMRAGAYGWQAAEAGFIGIRWSSPSRVPPAPSFSIWPCPSFLTELSRAIASAASCSPSTAASTSKATSPAIRRPLRHPGVHSPSSTGKAPASPSSS